MRARDLPSVEVRAEHLDTAAEAMRECGGSSVAALLRLGYEVRVDRTVDGKSRVRVYQGQGGYRAPVAQGIMRAHEAAALVAHAELLARREAERRGVA